MKERNYLENFAGLDFAQKMNSVSTTNKVGASVPNSQSHISHPSFSGTNPYDIPPTWCFPKEELLEMPSLMEGMTQEQEQQMRQQAAVFIQDMAEKLNSNVKDARNKITRNCMCVAMVHLHRFFVVHSMKMFDPRDVAAACLFLAGKGEECPRKLDHIVNVWFRLKNKIDRPFVLEPKVVEQENEYIVMLESIVLQTIGFILQVELPHPLILTAMNNLAKSSPSSRSLMETAYYFATDILLITDWCIRYTMRTLACVCIQLTCVWAEFKIPPAASNFKPWFQTVDPDLSEELLLALTDQFTVICANSDKSHVFRKRQQASAGKMRAGIAPPLPPTPSPSKILPPPPPPPMLTPESGSEAATAKRRIEESPDAASPKKVVKTETMERIHVMKKAEPVVSPKQEVVVDEWVAQASVLNIKDEPRKEKKKLALSEYRERRKEAASAFSNEVQSASSAEHHLSDGAVSETEQSAASSASVSVKVEIKTEALELPRRSFIPDVNTPGELIEMGLPEGIPMVKTEVKKEKSGSDKERDKRKREEDSARRHRHGEKHSRDSGSRDSSSHHHKSSSQPPSKLNQTLPAQQSQKYEKQAKPTMPQATGSSQPQPNRSASNVSSGQMASGQNLNPASSSKGSRSQERLQHQVPAPGRKLSTGYNQAATRPQAQVQQTGWSSPPSPVFESLSPSDRPVVPRPPQPQGYSQSRMPLPPTSSSMSAQSDSWRPVKPYKQSQSQRSSQRSSQNSAGGQDLEEGELA